MPKRKTPLENDTHMADADSQSEDEARDPEVLSDMEVSDEEGSVVDETDLTQVEFEFFDPRQGDFHAIKRFWSQLLGSDHTLLDTSGLADTVVGQPLLGTCVKTEGSESDPYALLSVLNLTHRVQEGEAPIQGLVEYLRGKVQGNAQLAKVLSLKKDEGHVAFLMSERLLNMPWQVAPPMYRMLAEEVTWAVEDGEPYQFAWYVLMSKVYRSVVSTADADMPDAPLPKGGAGKKVRRRPEDAETSMVHAEEEIIQEFAETICDFPLTQPPESADSKRAFQEQGIEPRRRLYLIQASKVPAMMDALDRAGS
ncbi:MAG: p21-C-terminal region-binding protein-domain-containing protein [Piptocephalis tieghemiana]|nr:MAG: p21-C-terminal region-binding protein-domain-containing protein [Piptocephalis tieghemiana]